MLILSMFTSSLQNTVFTNVSLVMLSYALTLLVVVTLPITLSFLSL
ncbi:MAG: hypothetical protein SH817_05695 [Leptospira sp.]|nr:hypothetical protein [Leptospira sp.]